jgi:putative hemolysin
MNSRLQILVLALILSALIISGCGTSAAQPTTGLANPASVYCEEQGYTLEMRTDENGTYGVCIFPDGNECEEWAFYRGECRPATEEVQPTEIPVTPTDAAVQVPDPAPAHDAAPNYDQLPVVAWYGYVASTPEGAQFDDYLVLLPEEARRAVGIEGADEAIQAEIVALRDKEEPGKHAHFWGALTCDVPDYGGCQLLVTHLRVDGPGPFFDPDPVEGWQGTIVSAPYPEGPRSGGDDYLVVLVDGIPIEYGIGSVDDALATQIESLRDTGTIVRVWGRISAGVIDWNATQIQVDRLEIAAEAPAASAGYDGWNAYTNERFGYSLKYPGDATLLESPQGTGIQITGPLVDNERWPFLEVSHFDSDFYRPPAGTDVAQWVTQFVLAYDEIDTGAEIAGLPAVHLTTNATERSYGFDEYYVIKDGQLFRINIIHAGGQEDWNLYNAFLGSFTLR